MDVYGAILCAGFGSRMAPITEAVPKPLIPFLNTPTLTYSLAALRAAGARAVGVNTHHLADAVQPVVDPIARALGAPIVYAHEHVQLGTGGGVRGIWRALREPDATLVVTNGDALFDADLRASIDAHRQSGRAVSLMTRPRHDAQPGRVWVDDATRRITRLRDWIAPDHDPSHAEHDFCGVHLLEPGALRRLELETTDIIDVLYGPMIAAGEAIGALELTGFWTALDTPSHHLAASLRCLNDPATFATAPLPEPVGDGLFVYNPGAVDPSALVRGPILLGASAEIGAGARIGPGVVLDGTRVAPGAVIENAILFGMGTVEGEWRDCVGVAGRVASVR